ncbi:hypothetical protein PHET_05935 [Paragonimus heterotremus]|uniref:Fibronectin type-III domain-containing protein n=1 Tax=Paragonimus heterotremus TaxID=100268 RepID=A0A8J4SNP5_9TREM|nr:hypothetical protein PHET_05935 [Paragonimus heterotremus]
MQPVTVFNWPLMPHQLVYWYKPNDVPVACNWTYSLKRCPSNLSMKISRFSTEGPHLISDLQPGNLYQYSVQINLSPYLNLEYSPMVSVLLPEILEPFKLNVSNIGWGTQMIEWKWAEENMANTTYDLIQKHLDSLIIFEPNVTSPIVKGNLLANTEYTYILIARSGRAKQPFQSVRSTLQTISDKLCMAPTNLKTVPFEQGLLLTWELPARNLSQVAVEKFYILIDQGIKTYSLPATNSGHYQYTVEGLTPCVRHTISVLSCSHLGDCSNAAEQYGIPLPQGETNQDCVWMWLLDQLGFNLPVMFFVHC